MIFSCNRSDWRAETKVNGRLIQRLFCGINKAQTYFMFKSQVFATRLGMDACCIFNGGKFISAFRLHNIDTLIIKNLIQ